MTATSVLDMAPVPGAPEVRRVRGPEDLTDLRQWSRRQTRIAIVVEPPGSMACASEDGTVRSVDLRSVGIATAVLEDLAMSGAYLWSHDATAAYSAIARHTGFAVDGLRCSQVLALSHDPDLEVDRSTLRIQDLRPEAKPGSAASEAVEIARMVASIHERSDKDERRRLLADVRVDELWRWPALRGYLLDQEILTAERQIVVEARLRSIDRFGVDLTADHAALKWMEGRGVICNAKGNPSCSHRDLPAAEVPDGMEDDWAAFADLRKTARYANSLKSIERNLTSDGRVRPRINAIGAKTGRMSITGPPMQAMPYQVRPAFLADEGKTLVACDLDRVEPCLVAAASGDPGLLAATQGDIYIVLAAKLWGEDARSDPERRAQAKTTLNAITYGQGAEGLGRRLGVETDEAQAILDRWSAAYPVFEKWKRGIISKAKKDQAPTTLAGRQTRQPEHPYQAVSYTIQGTAADLFKALTLNVADALPATFDLWLPVHDELIIQCPDDPASIDTALALLAERMQCEVRGVRIGGTPVHMGRSWRKI